MDTIAINANEALNEDGQDKKKNKVSDMTKATMAAGAAGMAVGAGAKAIADALGEYIKEETVKVNGGQSANSDEVQTESEAVENVVAEVNPDNIMLEEPVAEPATETDMIAEPAPLSSDEDPYRPFASNDNIEDEILPEPQPDETLIAENTEIDVIAGEDFTVDLLCGMPETEPEIIEEQTCPETDLYADNGSNYDDSDIQSDLMA